MTRGTKEEMEWTKDGQQRRQTLYRERDVVNLSRMYTFKRDSKVCVHMYRCYYVYAVQDLCT